MKYHLIAVLLLLKSVLLATDVSNGGLINSSGCICESKECCLGVNETSNDALSVRLSHGNGISNVTQPFTIELNKCPFGGAPGPMFSNGKYSMPIDCDDKWHSFSLNGGAQSGMFPVYIHYGGTCVKCGSICVLGPPMTKGSSLGLYTPPGSVDIDGHATNTAAGKEYAGVTDFLGRDPGGHCGDHGKALIVDLGIVFPNYNTWTDPNPPNAVSPQMKTTPTAHGNEKFGTITDDCGVSITLYCVSGNLFQGWVTDCTGKSRLVGSCNFPSAINDIQLYYEMCGTMKGLVRMVWINSNNSKDPADIKSQGKSNVYLYNFQTNIGSGTHNSSDGSTSDVPGLPPLNPPSSNPPGSLP